MSLEPFDIDTSPPTPELLEVARRELRETPETRAAAIEDLRRLLHNATDLHYRDDDDFLLIFLRPCHFYPESALKMVSFLEKSVLTYFNNVNSQDITRNNTLHVKFEIVPKKKTVLRLVLSLK